MPVKYSSKKEEVKSAPFLQSRSVKTLAKSNFTQVLGNKDTATLVMFYNPDCIYCQSAKPHFLKAAKTTVGKNHIYAAVDCTKEEQLCEAEHVQSYPTFKLYVGGRFLAKYNQSPNFVNIRNFMENASLATHLDPASMKNSYWKVRSRMPVKYSSKKEEVKSAPFLQSRSVKTLAKSNFTQVLGNKDTATLVMFYNPDCIYCQSAKPHFLKAAKTTVGKNHIYAAVDCTKEEQLCEAEHVQSYPTFKLYVGGRFLAKYNQSPNFVNFRNFMENAPLATHLEPASVKKDGVVYIPYQKKQ